MLKRDYRLGWFVLVGLWCVLVAAYFLFSIEDNHDHLTKAQMMECDSLGGIYLPFERVCLAPGSVIQLAPRK